MTGPGADERGPLFTAVVCTHNRAAMAARAVESLARQTLDTASYEVVAVDNASTDETADAVAAVGRRHPRLSLQVVREGALGLSHARNAGVAHARGRWVAFLDDDAVAEPRWLETARECIASVHPVPLAVGGPILPLFEAPPPPWFHPRYETRSWGEEPRWLARGETFSGSNMILSRDLFDRFGGFDPRVGVRGQVLSLGEETALFERLWREGGAERILYYEPRLRVRHSVPPWKMTLGYRFRRCFAAGQAWYEREGCGRWRWRVPFAAARLVQLAVLLGEALWWLPRHPHWRGWMYERVAVAAVEVGRLLACLGWKVPVKRLSGC
ncbi:MAG: hypothetical protein Kow0092_03620 [Deferrisomatales bacterium]